MSATPCPSCGKPGEGNYCSHCAAPLSGSKCHSCGARLSPGARFCHACGTVAGGVPERSSSSTPWPWIIGMVGTSLVFAALGFFAGRAGQSPTPAAAVAAGPTSSGITDISQMTPRERADRLFERIMTEHERNNTDQATFFRSMALDAYAMLGQLDADALYHVGLIHSVTGTPDLALAYADSLERGAPRHLFGPMLRQGIYMARGDTAGSRRAYRAFLERYEAERAANRPEYDLHDRAILTFRSEAQASESGRAN